MVGIYQDSFKELLREKLGDPVRVTNKNIICRCPWCEYNDTRKKHYHFYISLETPIFHCFFADCNKSGTVDVLIDKLTGNKDVSDKYIDRSKIKEVTFTEKVKVKDITIPSLNLGLFKYKETYLRERLKFSNISIDKIKNLVFDIKEFISVNRIDLGVTKPSLVEYLQSNFIGFVTEHSGVLVLRNIDRSSDFRFYKIEIKENVFMDYYKILGNSFHSNKVVISEGILDILAEQIFDTTGLKSDSKLYAACLSTNYETLLKSIVYNEHLFKLDVHVLSDRGMDLRYYRKIKKYNSHIIDKMTIYYGDRKDFGDVPSRIEKFIL